MWLLLVLDSGERHMVMNSVMNRICYLPSLYFVCYFLNTYIMFIYLFGQILPALLPEHFSGLV